MRTRRAGVYSCLAVAFLFGLLGLGVSTPSFAHEIAILKSADIAAYNEAVAGFKATATASTTFSEYDLQGNIERGRKLARKVRASNAALVLAVGLKAALVAKLEILDAPVVFCMVLDPVKYDLTAPNMTGILLETPQDRLFRAIREALPLVKRIGVVYDPEKTARHVREGRKRAKAVGLKLVARRVRTQKDVPGTLRAILPSVDALWLLPDSTVLNEDSLNFLVSTATESEVPLIGFSSDLVRSGALLGLFVNYEDIGSQASLLARQILDGQFTVPHAPMPPERVRMALNLKMAKFLGIMIPPHVTSRADVLY